MSRRIGFYLLLNMLIVAATVGQPTKIIFLDFGPDDRTNGNITGSPDENGNYWNNPTNPYTLNDPIELIDHTNQVTEVTLTMLEGMDRNGIQNGGLVEPDDALLGDFAIPTATQDYFFTTSTGRMGLSGLDPGKGYIFSIFGSRNTTGIRKSLYIIQGLNLIAVTLQTSGPGTGQAGYNGNDNEIVVTLPVLPDRTGKIDLVISIAEGDFAYINCMKIEEVEANPRVFVDLGPDDDTNGNATQSPDENRNYWNNLVSGTVSDDSLKLVDQYNNAMGGYLKVNTEFLSNGIDHGGLLSPDAGLLKDFAIPTATQDYFFTTVAGSLELGGLDTLTGYVFSFFGSREDVEVRSTAYTVNGADTISVSLQTSGVDLGGTGYNGNNSAIAVTDTIYPTVEGIFTIDVAVEQGGFAYLGIMAIDIIRPPYIPDPLCLERDELGIAFMGSSVAAGVGAANLEGYAFQYSSLLEERFGAGMGADWNVTNISVGGNSTLDVLGRWDIDLLSLCGSYVVYGLSMGNEGIHEFGRPRYEQFRDNMRLLVEQSRNNGIEPVIVNCYTRADFNATDYDYIKRMNLLIHSWDVASINVLGAIDDGAGRWAEGYEADPFHPNTAGHTEFFHSIVPSLFDALAAGKDRPERVNSTYITIDNPSDDRVLEYYPEGTIHPFAMTFDVRTSGSGQLGGIETNKGFGVLEIDPETGTLNYFAAGAKDISGSTVVNDNQWHRITLTHYYAWGKTFLYADGIEQGVIDEKIETSRFILGSADAPVADFRDWFIHRSGLNEKEVGAMVNDSLLNSSLDLYAPLDGQGVLEEDELVNLAQSLGEVTDAAAFQLTVGLDAPMHYESHGVQIFPNPADEAFSVRYFLSEESQVDLVVMDLLGREVFSEQFRNGQSGYKEHLFHLNAFEISYTSSIYLVALTINGKSYLSKLVLHN